MNQVQARHAARIAKAPGVTRVRYHAKTERHYITLAGADEATLCFLRRDAISYYRAHNAGPIPLQLAKSLAVFVPWAESQGAGVSGPQSFLVKLRVA